MEIARSLTCNSTRASKSLVSLMMPIKHDDSIHTSQETSCSSESPLVDRLTCCVSLAHPLKAGLTAPRFIATGCFGALCYFCLSVLFSSRYSVYLQVSESLKKVHSMFFPENNKSLTCLNRLSERLMVVVKVKTSRPTVFVLHGHTRNSIKPLEARLRSCAFKSDSLSRTSRAHSALDEGDCCSFTGIPSSFSGSSTLEGLPLAWHRTMREETHVFAS